MNKPSVGWYKLNSDGSSFGNPGKSSGGRLICDSNEVWIKGFTRNIGISLSVEAELWALRDDLSSCSSLNFVALKIDIDAKVTLDWV